MYGAEAPFLPLFQAFKLSQPSSISSTPLPPPAVREGTLPGRAGAQNASESVVAWPRAFAQKASEAAQRHKGAVRQRHAKVMHLGVARRGSRDSANRLGCCAQSADAGQLERTDVCRLPPAVARAASAAAQAHLAVARRRGSDAQSKALHSPVGCASGSRWSRAERSCAVRVRTYPRCTRAPTLAAAAGCRARAHGTKARARRGAVQERFNGAHVDTAATSISWGERRRLYATGR